MRRRNTVILLVALMLAACGGPVMLRPEARFESRLADGERIPARAALVASNGFRNFTYTGKPAGVTPARFYSLALGEPMGASLADGLASLFEIAPPRQAAVLILPEIEDFTLSYDERSGQAVAEIRLSIEAQARRGHVSLHKSFVIGRGAAKTSALLPADSALTDAASRAIADATVEAVGKMAADPTFRTLAAEAAGGF